MGQRENLVRTVHGAIVDSGVFGAGRTARVAMTYSPKLDNLPFCVFDIASVEFVGEDDDPADQIIAAEINVHVLHEDGFSAAKAVDELHDALIGTEMVVDSTGLTTRTEDYTPIGDRPRGLVVMTANYTVDFR